MRMSGTRGCLIFVTLLFLGVALLIAPVAPGSSAPAGASAAAFAITTQPALDPLVQSGGYRLRNPMHRLADHSSDYGGWWTGHYCRCVSPGPGESHVPLLAGQELQVAHGSSTYYIRCLPKDFPDYSASVTGQPQQANGYLVTVGRYSIVFDTAGVPVWWDTGVSALEAEFEPDFAEFLNPSTIAWSQSNGSFELVGLNGAVKSVVGGKGVSFDTHDFQLLPNGNYLGLDVTRNCPQFPASAWISLVGIVVAVHDHR